MYNEFLSSIFFDIPNGFSRFNKRPIPSKNGEAEHSHVTDRFEIEVCYSSIKMI